MNESEYLADLTEQTPGWGRLYWGYDDPPQETDIPVRHITSTVQVDAAEWLRKAPGPSVRDSWDFVEENKDNPADDINHPDHYTWLPGGLEAIDLTETFNFNLGNALKYIIRCDHKGTPEKDLQKAVWYLNREIERRQKNGE